MQGSGTQADPYILSSTSDLTLLSDSGYASYTGADVYFELGDDIDFNGGSFTPIGNLSYPFIGHFDGNDHVISNMKITSSSGNSGFFSRCSGACQISNIVFRDCSVTETGNLYCGMLLGYLTAGNGASISNIETDGCHLTSVTFYVGGIAGYGAYSSSGTVTYDSCYVHDGKVTSAGGVGGIASHGSYSSSSYAITYSNCTVEREVVLSSGGDIGGLVGYGAASSSNVTYSGCKVLSCVVKGSVGYIGGISCKGASSSGTVNYTNCEVDNTYIISSSNGYVGGIVGFCYSGPNVTCGGCSVINSTIYGNSYIGGVVGYVQSTVTITNPTISHNNIISSGGTYCGGAIGYNVSGTVSGGTQDYNNIVGSGGINVSGYTNQTSVSSQYITAESLSAVVGSDNKTVTFTVTGQRGAGVSYDTTTNLIDGGMNWQYTYPSSSTEEVNFELEKVYSISGTFTPKLHLYNPQNTTGVILTANEITTEIVFPKTNHDQSFLRRNERY